MPANNCIYITMVYFQFHICNPLPTPHISLAAVAPAARRRRARVCGVGHRVGATGQARPSPRVRGPRAVAALAPRGGRHRHTESRDSSTRLPDPPASRLQPSSKIDAPPGSGCPAAALRYRDSITNYTSHRIYGPTVKDSRSQTTNASPNIIIKEHIVHTIIYIRRRTCRSPSHITPCTSRLSLRDVRGCIVCGVAGGCGRPGLGLAMPQTTRQPNLRGVAGHRNALARLRRIERLAYMATLTRSLSLACHCAERRVLRSNPNAQSGLGAE